MSLGCQPYATSVQLRTYKVYGIRYKADIWNKTDVYVVGVPALSY
jgi:hypothetical protein